MENMILGFETIFTIGEDNFFESISSSSPFGVTFEDDCTTGYFYAVDKENGFRILDALHIYNVENVVDNNKPSKLQIAWDENWQIASLLINNYCHAIFDFNSNAGYCRNGFPESMRDWIKISDRFLTDNLIDEIFRINK
jgi:hypothetical protein